MSQANEKDDPLEAGTSGPSRLKVRLHGLLLMSAGFGLTPVFFVVAYLLGRLLQLVVGGPVPIAAGLVAIPMVMSFVGWLEFLTGAPFSRLAQRFDTAGSLTKLGLSLLVIASIIAFIALAVNLYKLVGSWGWL